jgi:hypothetical protein
MAEQTYTYLLTIDAPEEIEIDRDAIGDAIAEAIETGNGAPASSVLIESAPEPTSRRRTGAATGL